MDENGSSSPIWAIEVQGLTKSYGNHHALVSIDLKVRRGDHLTIFGPNGAGKTTLIKLLSNLSKPSSGSVRLDGIDIRGDPIRIRRKVGVVSHPTFLYDNLTIYDNLKFYGRMYGVPNLEHRIREVVSLVKLEARLGDRVGTLSRGMQQRVSIARAVLHNPSIMLLDEPETGLDPHASMMIRDVLYAIDSADRTVVMTSHNLEQGLELGDQVVILDKGRIAYAALKQEIDTASFQGIYDRCIGLSK